MPIAANISPGNVHDSQRASNVLQEARAYNKNTGHPFRPRYIIGDKGYSSKALFQLIHRQYHPAQAVIDVNRGHKRLLNKFSERMATPE